VTTWLKEAREKAAVLQDGMASVASFARQAGLSEEQQETLLSPYRTALEELYTSDFSLARLLDNSDLVVHLEGPALDKHTPSLTILSNLFFDVNAEVRNIAAAILGMARTKELPKDLNLGLAALAPGSLYVGLNVTDSSGDSEQLLGNEIDPYVDATRKAVKTLGVVSKFVSGDVTESAFAENLPDPRVRDVAISAMQRLAPSNRSVKNGVNSIEIGVRNESGGESSSVKLTPETKQRLRDQLTTTMVAPYSAEYVGWIREVDLDLRRFEIRRLEIGDALELRCRYQTEFEGEVLRLVNCRARVNGFVQLDAAGKPSLMEVVGISGAPPPAL
jgi:hypothetical protein